MTAQEAYTIIELEYGEKIDAVRKAFRRLALKYHPDRNGDSSEATEKFKEINNAYEFLCEYISDPGSVHDDSQYDYSYEEYTRAASNACYGNPFAHHQRYHERYKNGEFGECDFFKRAS